MSFTCWRCNEDYGDRHPATRVACPDCLAPVGVGCKRPSGHGGNFVEPHVAREQLAVDQGLLTMCPAARPQVSQEQQPALL